MCKYICVTILYQVTNVVYRGMKMNLKKCNDCHQEISINVDGCPNCGSKKPFKNIKLTLEETKQLNSNEKKRFLKLGGDVSYTKIQKFFGILVLIFILILLLPVLLPKSAEQIKKEKDELIQNVKSLSKDDVDANYRGYEKLVEYFPEDSQYKEKLDFYQNRIDMAMNCRISAREQNKRILNNPTTYDDSFMDNYRIMEWKNVNEYIFQTSFKGKNSFGVEQKLVSKYKCVYNNGKMKIEQISLNKALD